MKIDAGAPHKVPLSRQAIELLQALPETDETDLLFPSAMLGVVLSDTRLSQLMRALEMPSDQPPAFAGVHGFRTSLRTWLTDEGCPDDIGAYCLAHDPDNASEKAYKRTKALEQRRPWMQRWADHIDTPVTAPSKDNVTPIKRKKAA